MILASTRQVKSAQTIGALRGFQGARGQNEFTGLTPNTGLGGMHHFTTAGYPSGKYGAIRERDSFRELEREDIPAFLLRRFELLEDFELHDYRGMCGLRVGLADVTR